MIASTKFGTRILAAVAIVLALAALAGCGSKEKAQTPAAEKTTASAESQGMSSEQKTEAAPDAQPAVDWSAYSNPKPGVDPVCQMNLDPAYVTEVTIAGKTYAMCSSRCADMLSQNPDQYLSAAASAEESHEGHTH
jgi:YHS domain-containing protein/predicted small lipoprotein YifL